MSFFFFLKVKIWFAKLIILFLFTEEVVSQKRKSDVGGGDATDSGSPTEGISPEKKAKLEEKVENGEAEATA